MKPTWERDGIQLYLGDCLEILPTLESESVDMIWTDPPYGHGNMDGDLQSARVRDGVKGARVKVAEPIQNDKGSGFEKIVDGFLSEASRVLVRDCCCCCCIAGGGPKPTFARLSQKTDEVLSFFQAVVWDKSARGHGMGWRYRRNYEFILVSHRKGGRLLWADDSIAVPNIVRNCPVIERIHPNEKPLQMVVDFIGWHTADSEQTILDPFMGSGTTGVACVKLGRKFIGVEKEPKYFEIAVKRIERALSEERFSLFPVAKETQSELFQGMEVIP